MHELGELQHLHAGHRDIGAAAQHVEQAGTEVAGKPLVDHLQGRQTPAHDAVLTGEVVAARLVRIEHVVGIGFDIAAVDAMQQRIDFVLRKKVCAGHDYCITNWVKNTPLTSPGDFSCVSFSLSRS